MESIEFGDGLNGGWVGELNNWADASIIYWEKDDEEGTRFGTAERQLKCKVPVTYASVDLK